MRHVSKFLDDAERSGRFTLAAEQIAAALPELSPEALRHALFRQQRRGRIVRVARGAGQWLIVPLMYAESGAPPLEAWLHSFLADTLKLPYYVGLLSAAEAYGVAPYAPTGTQVVVERQRRPITVGRQRLSFHTRSRVPTLPTRWHETPDGRYLVSTPELTLLDLVRRQELVGGVSRVAELIPALAVHARPEALSVALSAADELPTAQRLGALLAHQGSPLADIVAAWLRGKTFRAIPLVPGGQELPHKDARFRVLMPNLEASNT